MCPIAVIVLVVVCPKHVDITRQYKRAVRVEPLAVAMLFSFSNKRTARVNRSINQYSYGREWKRMEETRRYGVKVPVYMQAVAMEYSTRLYDKP